MEQRKNKISTLELKFQGGVGVGEIKTQHVSVPKKDKAGKEHFGELRADSCPHMALCFDFWSMVVCFLCRSPTALSHGSVGAGVCICFCWEHQALPDL